MILKYRTFELKLKHPFKITRGVRTSNQVVLIEIEHDGLIGYGEAPPSPRYGESVETVKNFLEKVDLSKFNDPLQVEDILNYVDSIEPGNNSAKAGIDIALHDLVGKILNVPLYKLFGLNKEKTPITSFTIGIDEPEVIERKVKEAEEYTVLKVKLGLENDYEIIRTIRKVTDKPIRVDANEGWKTKEIALEKIKWLQNEGVEFVEQPMPADDLDSIAWVRDRVELPIMADENCVRLWDVPILGKAYDGINIKLMKCTGIREAVKMINTARAMNMKVMLGCMIESSVGITAGAQISPLVDFADLDGNLLITNDPFDGVKVKDGKLILPDEPGLGVKKLI
jgi:L-alanine-DL-glutamate epimerase-like enolase superfamily enzyme